MVDVKQRPGYRVNLGYAAVTLLAVTLAAASASATEAVDAVPTSMAVSVPQAASTPANASGATPPSSAAVPLATPVPPAEQANRDGESPKPPATAALARDETADMASFLDRLMLAESGGRDTAKNPRSTATGPFQFIESTFIAVARRHFHDETAALTDAELLARRTDRDLARRAAEAYTRENARALAAAGHAATFANLRLAFLLGADGASRVLAAKPEAKLTGVLAPKVLAANPFMKPMTAADLVRRSSREVALRPDGAQLASATVTASGVVAATLPKRPRIVVRCKVALASCRAWVAREERKLARKTRQARR